MEQSREYYDRIAAEYAKPSDPYVAKYHEKRYRLATQMLSGLSGQLFDFGCGTGELLRRLPQFKAEGCDISREMIEIAKRLSPTAKVAVGGVEYFTAQRGPYDAVVCLNTLTYLTEDDETALFEHAREVAKYVLISHGNRLFDLVTLNRYTVDFFKRECGPSVEGAALAMLPALLTNANLPPGGDNNASDREIVPKRSVDPFTYRPNGFDVMDVRPFNTFPVPPAILQSRPDWQLAQIDMDLPGTLGLLFSSQFWMLLRVS